MNDAFALADSTMLSYSTAMKLTKYLKDEREYVPWSVAAAKFASLKQLLMFTDIYTEFKKYVIDTLLEAYKTVGWNVEEDDKAHLKKSVIY